MSWIVLGGEEEGARLAARTARRLEERIASGVLDAAEIERVSAMSVRLLSADPLVSEAFRRACVAWRIDAPVAIRSHRKLVGPVLIFFKRLLSRILRFHVEVPLSRQAEFNRNLLVVLHELVRRSRDPGPGAVLMPRAIHQLVPNLAVGDAISQQVLTLQRMLRSLGRESEVYAQHVHVDLAGEARPLRELRAIDPEAILLYHFSIGSEATDVYRLLPNRRVLVYHNITPPEWFHGVNEKIASLCGRGRDELAGLRGTAALAIADSEFNRRELLALGYDRAVVMPIVLDEERFRHRPVARLERSYRDGHVNFLHVGRLVPNKRLEDVLKVFWFFRRKIEPDSRLFLVGIDVDTEIYSFALREWVEETSLPGVVFTGGVSPRELAAYYRLAHVYLCMSEHEGFCAPLVEAMHLGVPVVAYAAGAVPETLGDGGVLVREKRFAEIAEIAGVLLGDDALRKALVERGRARAHAFTTASLLSTLREVVAACESG